MNIYDADEIWMLFFHFCTLQRDREGKKKKNPCCQNRSFSLFSPIVFLGYVLCGDGPGPRLSSCNLKKTPPPGYKKSKPHSSFRNFVKSGIDNDQHLSCHLPPSLRGGLKNLFFIFPARRSQGARPSFFFWKKNRPLFPVGGRKIKNLWEDFF